MIAAIASVLLSSCTAAHGREVDRRLRERFGIAGDARETSLDSAVKVAVIKRVPLGSREEAIYAYLESTGFQRASRSTGPANRNNHNYYFPRENSMKVEATLEDFRARWYSPIDVCDRPVTVIFDLDVRLQLSNIDIVRHGYCI
jgi:hypothetical protein